MKSLGHYKKESHGVIQDHISLYLPLPVTSSWPSNGYVLKKINIEWSTDASSGNEGYIDSRDERQRSLEQKNSTMIHNIGGGRPHGHVVASVCLSVSPSLMISLSQSRS